MSESDRRRPRIPRRRTVSDPLAATERWFLANGLSYFVPAERARAAEALRPRRALPLVGLALVVIAALGGLLGRVSQQVSAAPATWLSLAVVAAVGYVATALRAGPILTFAAVRTTTSVRLLVSTLTRALPLLLVFVAFLFINAEAWEMTASLSLATHWVVALLLLGTGVVFLMVRLPEEVDALDDAVDDAFLTRACAGTPLEAECARLLEDPDADPASFAAISGFERWNLILALLVIQLVQVVALVAGIFVFLLVFGSIIMHEQTQLNWTGLEAVQGVPGLPSVSVQLAKVSLFLSAFSGLYFTVSAVTDDTFRSQFFSLVIRELERAVGVRAVYLSLRAERGED